MRTHLSIFDALRCSRWHLVPIAASVAVASCSMAAGVQVPSERSVAFASPHGGLPPIQHVIIIEMENRSFDNYFATFPGANGIPMDSHGVPLVRCNPDVRTGRCVLPYHDTQLVNYGGPHTVQAAAEDIDGGRFDGFIAAAEGPRDAGDPHPDEVMGYHTQAELPYYWKLASDYTLADEFFAATSSYSTIAHLFLVSGWSAHCTSGDPMSCVSTNNVNVDTHPTYAWTDITWLLHRDGVSWAYFVFGGGAPHQASDDDEYVSPFATFNQLSEWNPMPGFEDVTEDGQENDLMPGTTFVSMAQSGTLPSVSWVIPPASKSDHPPHGVDLGQQWVQSMIAAVQRGPDWPTTAIFLQWDEWGGFYDHATPPAIDDLGYGLRAPLIIVSPLVKKRYIDHQLLSSDAELKFIEDLFCGSARLDASDGRPDSRPDIREDLLTLGDLRRDFTP